MPKAPRATHSPRFHAAATQPLDPALDFGQSVTQSMGAMATLTIPSAALSQIQDEYLRSVQTLWNSALEGQPNLTTIEARPDRRFASGDWASNPVAAFSATCYLLNAKTLLRMASALQGDEKTRRRVQFAVEQWVNAISPSNFLAFNPEAQRKAVETQGESLTTGLFHLLQDIQQGHLSQTDERLFEVGRNVATTEGAVVFENEFFQLIEYKPLTTKVYQRPLLIVPPCINKYYILDLQPENSLVRYALEQGHRVFLMSWVNATESLSNATWDDYVQHGPIRAIHEVLSITKQAQLNALGFCVGGTILSCALSVLSSQGEMPVSSLTLLTTLLDFANTGILDLFVDEALVQMREVTIGLDSPTGGGLLKGRELASTFSFLRPNELVWNYVVGNYLKGEMPPPFDLLYWNSDSTNLPGPMYCWYLRHTYLQNQLREPHALTVCGHTVDLAQIDIPAYIYGSREDHIVPWESAYASTRLLSGKARFVLGASGHIAGVINPPTKNRRNYWVNADLPATASSWLDDAKAMTGSWWPDWSQWLVNHAGRQIPAPKQYGDVQHPIIEPAPGRYVRMKV